MSVGPQGFQSTRRAIGISIAGAVVLVGISVPPAGASPGGVVAAAPLGVPAPASGWTPVFADGFNAPLGTAPGYDNLWFPNMPTSPYAPSVTRRGDNTFDVQAYNSSQVSVINNSLVETAVYDSNILPANGPWAQDNYLSGIVSTPTSNKLSCSATKTTSCYRGWDWVPAPGPTWAFQIVCQWPVNTGELFNSFWTMDDNGPAWTDERDFFEGFAPWQITTATPASDSMIDSDWIFSTVPVIQDIFFSYTETRLGFDPAAGYHTFTYVVNPDTSWSFYIDGAKQTWIGNGTGISPPESSPVVPMLLKINYALKTNTFTSGTRQFSISSVAVYEDTQSASAPGHPYSSGVTIAPRTTIGSN